MVLLFANNTGVPCSVRNELAITDNHELCTHALQAFFLHNSSTMVSTSCELQLWPTLYHTLICMVDSMVDIRLCILCLQNVSVQHVQLLLAHLLFFMFCFQFNVQNVKFEPPST